MDGNIAVEDIVERLSRGVKKVRSDLAAQRRDGEKNKKSETEKFEVERKELRHVTTTPADATERGRRIGDSVGMIRRASTRGIKSELAAISG